MFKSARRPCKACDGAVSSADSRGETGCILGYLIKELFLEARIYAVCLNDGVVRVYSRVLLTADEGKR